MVQPGLSKAVAGSHARAATYRQLTCTWWRLPLESLTCGEAPSSLRRASAEIQRSIR
jgi:hypothetical protein